MTIQTDPQYKLRLPPELHAKIKQAAERNHRSMNAEMVARLGDSFKQRGLSISSLDMADRIKTRDAIEVLAEAQRLLEIAESKTNNDLI
tara:strand:+ start:708 stop:974 length:267 start_codon:yes stop_codon:yes gene_type:complete